LNSLAIASVVFGCSFGAALIGMTLHVKVPDHQLDPDSRDVVKLVMGLIATMSALVLGLLIASANSSYDQQKNELNAISAKIVLLDRTLEFYGPDAKAARDSVRDTILQTHDWIWSPEGVRPEVLDSIETRDTAKSNSHKVQRLSPKTDDERMLKSQAIRQLESISESRLLMVALLGSSIPWPFLTVLVFWISTLFLGFGMFARFNATVTVALLVGALSVAGAIFLILELNDPYRGIMRISDEPLRGAISQIEHQ
jgi:predicted transposase YbfD/YdcC